ncbi:hypothetical protein Vadar_019386 [Vaccinium darrowii]|uniref:Uncharacterized protein n=1 Tax=Vaccinium darrowii TaxID=229202 RepID=A0ACB7YP62_9ERIC|nr:hypothetical protein Vadar_019386 [Vaccinium darrowii]
MNWISVNGGDSLYFNLEQESIHTLPMPRPICGRVWYFGESSNHLHHVACDESRIILEFRIYEMERDYSGWFVKYSVTLGDIRDVCLEMGLDRESFFSILCILRRENGSEDESVLVFQLKGNRTVVWYNLMGKPFNKVLDLAPTTSSADANSNESSCTNRIVAEFKIYEMERDYSCWFVKYSVTVDDVRDACREMDLDMKSLFSILCILRRENGNEEESLLVVQLNVNGTVIRYNLTGKPFKKVLDFAPTTSSADANSNE